MNQVEKHNNSMHGLKWGLIISAVYIVFLFLRFRLGAGNIMYMSIFTVLGFITVMILLFFTGYTRKKELGGFIELKDAFQTMFVAIVIYEFIYALFNFIYLKYIDPEFFVKIKQSTEDLLQRVGTSQSDIDKQLDRMDVESAGKMNGASLFMNYLTGLAVSGVFALIFALILKKRREPFDQTDSFLQQQ